MGDADSVVWESRYRAVFEGMPDAVFIIDATEDGSLRFGGGNAAWERLEGIASAPLVGRPVEAIVPADRASGLLGQLRRCLGRRETIAYDGCGPMFGTGGRTELAVTLTPVFDAAGGGGFLIGVARDVTSQRALERTLSVTRLCMDHAAIACFRVDDEGYIRDGNIEACRSLGYSYEELTRLTVFDIDPAFDAEKWVYYVDVMDAAHDSYTFESVHRRKDGSMFPVEVSVTNHEHEGRKFSFSFARDISERAEAERRLHASEQAFRALVENSPDCIARYDLEGRRLYVNPAMQRLFRQPLEEILDTTPRVDSPLSSGARLIELIRQVAATGKEVTEENAYLTPEGRMKWGHMRIVPEFDPDGRVASVLAVGRDITEVKESERRFRTLAENFPDVIARFDGEGRYLYVNLAAVRMSGMEPEAFLGKRLAELPLGPRLDPDGGLAAARDRAYREGVPNDIEAVWQCGERQRIVEVRHVPEKDEAGRVISVLGIARDVTARRTAERHLEQSRLELRRLAVRSETAREKERRHIARELHDDLGQRLAALRLDAAVIERLAGGAVPGLKARGEALVASVDAIVATLRSLVTSMRPTVIDMGLGAALEWLVSDFTARSGIACGLQVDDSWAPDASRTVVVFRIVQESLANILRHSGATRAEIALAQGSDGWMTLVVRDNGCGFDPTVRRPHSFGLLGLHERALMLGGALEVVSEPGAGTVVTVSFPLAVPEEPVSIED